MAYQALQMHNSGASVTAIRDAIEKKYRVDATSRGTHTPYADAQARRAAELAGSCELLPLLTFRPSKTRLPGCSMPFTRASTSA